MDAMIAAGARVNTDGARRLSDIWQLPVLMLSLALSLCAAYLFVDAKPSLAFNQKLASIRQYLQNQRPDAAAQSLARIVASERLPREHEAQVHLLLAESIDAAQKQRHDAPAANYQREIEELQIALEQGVKPSGDILLRLGECDEALGKSAEALSQYRRAIAIDPPLALRLQRKIIDLQRAVGDVAGCETSLSAYLAGAGISDAERAWAENQRAQLLIDRREYVDARRLLEDALRLDGDAVALAQTRYRLGVCAWKTGKIDEAQALITAARATFNGQHPLDAAAATALGSIAQEKNDSTQAIAMFDAAIAEKPEAAMLLRAHLARASCLLQMRKDDAAVADLRDAADVARSAPQTVTDQTISALRQASGTLVTRENDQAAIDVLGLERSLDANPPAEFHARLASVYEKRAEQIEQSSADATGSERVRRLQLAREFRGQAASAYADYSKALASAGDAKYAGAFWKGIDLCEAAGNQQAEISALELFVTEHADDPLAPEALARLGKTYESIGKPDQAIGAYQRLQGAYPKTASAARTALPLALLYVAKDAAHVSMAVTVLTSALSAGDADVCRDALLELSRIQHRASDETGSLSHLQQFARDYPTDGHLGEVNFLAAECSAHIAAQIDARLASASASSTENAGGVAEMTQAAAAKKQHLLDAAAFYDKAAEFYRNTPPTREEDRRFEQLATLRRADCAYELGDYEAAVKLYELAARSVSDSAQVVAANVQIANAYFAMHKPDDARQATDRARQLLHKLSPAGSPEAAIPLPEAYWEQWLKWTGSGGTW